MVGEEREEVGLRKSGCRCKEGFSFGLGGLSFEA